MNSDGARRRPIIDWLILVYDGTAQERFPLRRQWYRFNYERASEGEASAVLRLLNWDDRQTSLAGPKRTPGEAAITASLSGEEIFTSTQILKYRHLFDPMAEDSVVSKEELLAGVLSVTLRPDAYFEDENAQPISMTEMQDREARREGGENAVAIVTGHPESVLRFGPTSPVRSELWSDRDADVLAQFFSTYRFLVTSRWFVSHCEVAPSRTNTGGAILPVPEDCMSVILPFRQIYSSDGMDDLFNRSCRIHNRHCPKGSPHHWWTEHYRKACNSYVHGRPNAMWVNTDLCVKRYLDAFAYGAGIVHATSKTNAPQADLGALLANTSKDLVVFRYHSILHTLLRYVSQAVPIIHQNVHHWTTELGWPTSARLAAQELFDASSGVDAS